MSDTIEIKQHATYFSLAMGRTHKYAQVVRDFIRQKLFIFEWNPRARRTQLTKQFIVYRNSEMRMPISYLPIFSKFLNTHGIDHVIMDILPVVPDFTGMVHLPGWETRPEQVEPVKFLTSKKRRKALKLQTGKGKTFISMKSASEIGQRTIVLVDQLDAQWMETIEEQFGYTPPKSYLIKGIKSLVKLSKLEIKPDIFVCSIRTIRNFIEGGGNYSLLPWTYEEFLFEYGIGVKIIDEIHENFIATNIIELHSNVLHNIYLSATFGRGNEKEDAIFNTIYSKDIMYGGNEYDRYVEIYYYQYAIDIGRRKVVYSRGYMHAKYEQAIFKTQKFRDRFIHILKQLIDSHYINKKKEGQKCLLFLTCVENVNTAVILLRKIYPDLYTNPYIAGSQDSILKNSDIVITTVKKSSTGLDITDLLTVINTCASQSSNEIQQVLGRLRKLNDGSTPIMVDMFNRHIDAQVRYARTRDYFYSDLGLKYRKLGI